MENRKEEKDHKSTDRRAARKEVWAMMTAVCLAPQKSVQNRTKKQILDVPKHIVKAARLVPREPVHCTKEQIVNDPSPQTRTEVQIVDMFLPPCWEDIVDVIIVIPQERISDGCVEPINDEIVTKDLKGGERGLRRANAGGGSSRY